MSSRMPLRGQLTELPSDTAAVKLLWLAICNIEDRRTRQGVKRPEFFRG